MQNTLSVSDTYIEAGLTQVNWPARLELLQSGATEIWYDGGHNKDAGQVIAQWIIDQNHTDARPLHLIVGMKRDKDANAFLSPLASLADSLQIVPVHDVGLCIDATHIESSAQLATNANSIKDALTHITNSHTSQQKKRILICGSLYLAREISDTLDA